MRTMIELLTLACWGGVQIMAVEFDVAVVGSCMTDLVSYVPRLPKPGETIHGSKFVQGFGGKGANQCVMAAKLGARAAMVAKVGDDSFGLATIDNFNSHSINSDYLMVTNEAASGVAAISVNEQGENSIVIVSGSNEKLTPLDVLRAEEMIKKSAVVICQLEVPKETSCSALKLAKSHGRTTIFNVAPGVSFLDQDFYTNADILCLNETEMEMVTGLQVTDVPSGRKAVECLQERVAGCVVLTLGENGVLFTERSSPTEIKHVEAERVEVVDTTGAGDAFVGAMAYFLSCHSHLPFQEVVRRSCVIATCSVRARGTQSSYCVEHLPKELFLS